MTEESKRRDVNQSSGEILSSSPSPTSSTGTSTGSRCPVNYGAGTNSESVPPPSAAATTFWTSFFTKKKSNEAVSDDDRVNTTNNTIQTSPASVEEAARYAQLPQPDQKIRLATTRQVSSIPRVGTADTLEEMSSSAVVKTELPHHQQGTENETTKWVYPSEQQLYNAMRRKGWQNIPEDTIPTVLQIHNTINERTWKLVESWEGSSNIYLNRFQGRPKDLSPKAFIMCHLLRMYDIPFDRHDWYIKHNDNTEQVGPIWNKWLVAPDTEQRYVIDYYYIQPSNPSLPPIPYVDARPALDHPRALYLRTKRFLQDSFPGITTFLQQRQQLQEQEKEFENHQQDK